MDIVTINRDPDMTFISNGPSFVLFRVLLCLLKYSCKMVSISKNFSESNLFV